MQIIYTPVMELSSLKLCIRNYRACIKKLSMTKKQRDQEYWSSACQHWDGKIAQILGAVPEPLQTTKDLLSQFQVNLDLLRKEVDGLIVDDLEYRLKAIVDTLLIDPAQREVMKDGSLTIEE